MIRRRLNDFARVAEGRLIAARIRLSIAAAFIWRRLMFRTTFIAITGSVGKTTTKELIAAILAGSHTRVMANFASENTLPEIASTMLRVRPGHRFAIFEIAAGGKPGRIASGTRLVAPHIAVILSVARTHTHTFPTPEATAREKADLLKYLGPGGVAILNTDDPHVSPMTPPRGTRLVRFGTGADADLRAEYMTSVWPRRLSFQVKARSPETRAIPVQIDSQLVGLHWTSALLAALAIARECGIPLDRAASLISQIPPTPGRMDPRVLPNGAVILRDEFNPSLDTYRAAFEVLRFAKAQRKALVISTVTDTPEGWNKRTKRIASEAAGVVDLLVLIGERTYTEKSEEAALKAGMAPDAVRTFEDLREAAAFLHSELRDGDLVLLRGKTEHHLTRLYYAQLLEVACWKQPCDKMILCDHCAELFGSAQD